MVTAAAAAPVVVAVVAAAVAAAVVVAAIAGAPAAPAVVATAAVAMLLGAATATGGGAVTGADIDCHYGPSKSNVSVMKISKRIKEEKKHTGDSRHICVLSPPFSSNNHRDAAAPSLYVMVVMVAVCLAKLGGGKNEGRKRVNDERKFNLTT